MINTCREFVNLFIAINRIRAKIHEENRSLDLVSTTVYFQPFDIATRNPENQQFMQKLRAY